MPEAVNEDAPFALLERSELFAFLLDLIQRVYRPSIQSAVTDYGLVIVGGQSLTLWARQYLIDEMTGEDVGFVTSDDLDFIGKPNSIDYCARVMGVPFRKAKMDDNTINIAAAYIDWVDDKEVIVDILEMNSVGGSAQKRDFNLMRLLFCPENRVRLFQQNRLKAAVPELPLLPIVTATQPLKGAL
ncbi:hypothetical protein [Pseudomonas sp. SWRI18]|uniref:hypothetical protein n=1 Tax=Pseudomonas sp. SWRI18 TaxID=2753888 RepID=UPI001EE207D0|nr:hypothetical protein [Pseudomonas sp. SWRI18]